MVRMPSMLWLRIVLAVAASAAVIVLVTHKSSTPDRKRQAAQTQREIARLAAARRNNPVVKREIVRLRAEQRPRVGRVPQRRPSPAAQAATTAALERSITLDAQARYRRHELEHPVLNTTCEYIPRPRMPRPVATDTGAGYDCTAVTVRVRAVPGQVPGEIIGFPFLARVNFRTGRFVWCKVSRRPAEHGTGDELAFVPVPKVCDVLPNRA